MCVCVCGLVADACPSHEPSKASKPFWLKLLGRGPHPPSFAPTLHTLTRGLVHVCTRLEVNYRSSPPDERIRRGGVARLEENKQGLPRTSSEARPAKAKAEPERRARRAEPSMTSKNKEKRKANISYADLTGKYPYLLNP